MIKPAWVIGPRYIASNPTVLLNDVVDHIDHICQLAGNSRHAAIGTDLDGGFGREQSPADLDTIAARHDRRSAKAARFAGRARLHRRRHRRDHAR
jgi:microsomal dipeptidase-like Zn-dependent dipeptidase